MTRRIAAWVKGEQLWWRSQKSV